MFVGSLKVYTCSCLLKKQKENDLLMRYIGKKFGGGGGGRCCQLFAFEGTVHAKFKPSIVSSLARCVLETEEQGRIRNGRAGGRWYLAPRVPRCVSHGRGGGGGHCLGVLSGVSWGKACHVMCSGENKYHYRVACASQVHGWGQGGKSCHNCVQSFSSFLVFFFLLSPAQARRVGGECSTHKHLKSAWRKITPEAMPWWGKAMLVGAQEMSQRQALLWENQKENEQNYTYTWKNKGRERHSLRAPSLLKVL